VDIGHSSRWRLPGAECPSGRLRRRRRQQRVPTPAALGPGERHHVPAPYRRVPPDLGPRRCAHRQVVCHRPARRG
jgi:hypothetical protein